MKSGPPTILAISGSLRAASSNSLIIRQVGRLIAPGVQYKIFEGLANIPAFDDAPEIPPSVEQWRNTIAAANGVLFCTPEYAFGVPGTLKNALDWTVASTVFNGKPVALITAASVGDKAHASLLHTLAALGTEVVDDLLISFVRAKMNSLGEIADKDTLDLVKTLVLNLVTAAVRNREEE